MAHIFHVDDLSRISENIGSVLVEKQGLVRNLQGMLLFLAEWVLTMAEIPLFFESF